MHVRRCAILYIYYYAIRQQSKINQSIKNTIKLYNIVYAALQSENGEDCEPHCLIRLTDYTGDQASTSWNGCVRWLSSSAYRWSVQKSILYHPKARLGILLNSLAMLGSQVSFAYDCRLIINHCNLLNLSVPFVRFRSSATNCEHDSLKTDEPISMPIGTSGPRGKGTKRSTLGTGGQRSRSHEAANRYEGLAEASVSTCMGWVAY